MNSQNPNAAARTRAILEDLEAVRENLLALSDDIWLSIDHNDSESLEAGVEFKRAYNSKVCAFDSVATVRLWSPLMDISKRRIPSFSTCTIETR